LKTDLKYFFLVLIWSSCLGAQVKQFNLEKGNAQKFKGRLYVYGLVSTEKKAVFCVYQLNSLLQVTDSVVIPAGKSGAENFLQITSDTLHNYLNFYLQEKEKKLATVFRFDNSFKLMATIDNIDIARLNSISDFETEVFYFRNEVYTVKSQKDTSGLQFYLNKYTLKSETKNFEYAFTWQFPFERKHINSAHIFYASRQSVLLYVNICNGQKSGQWILNINAVTGKLTRGTKLNDKGELNTYQFGNFLVDTVNRSLLLTGQKFTGAQFNQSDNKLSITNAPHALVYLIEIDSLSEVINKQDFKIPTAEPKTTSKKIINNYILRIGSLARDKAGRISFETDIFKNTDNGLCYRYSNTEMNYIVQGEESLVIEKSTIASNPLVEKFYFSQDPLDMNGKLLVDSLKNFEKLFYKTFTFPVKLRFKNDTDGNPLWILTKTDVKKNNINFSYLAPVKKIYQLTVIEEIPKTNNPVFFNLGPAMFLIARQSDEKHYELKSFTW